MVYKHFMWPLSRLVTTMNPHQGAYNQGSLLPCSPVQIQCLGFDQGQDEAWRPHHYMLSAVLQNQLLLLYGCQRMQRSW